MTRIGLAAVLVAALVVGSPRPAAVQGQAPGELAGRWTLNRELSQFPPEVGFAADWLTAGGAGLDPSSGGGRGRRGSGGGGGAAAAFSAPRESEDDAKRVQQLTAEVREPSAHLTIVDTAGAVVITDDHGRSRTFHTDGKEEVVQLDGVPVAVVARRDTGRLAIAYKVEKGRELRYTYTRAPGAPQLVVDVQFVERGTGDAVRRVYQPASATESVAPPPAPAQAPPATAARPPDRLPPTNAPASGLPNETFNQQPDAELKGLTKLGVVVEGLTAQATACGLSQSSLEAAAAKHLSDAGFTVLRDSDEDSYVYVNIMTSSLPGGVCVSRYDVFFYTHTTARLSYQPSPVLVQVSLLHKGGMTGGASAAHAAGVTRDVLAYLDQFVTRIRDANKPQLP